MKVPLKWLKEYVQIPSKVSELTDRLTAIGHMQDHPPVEVAGDTVLDLEVRQNRSDCLSLVGLAREVAASLEAELTVPKSVNVTLSETANTFSVEISNPEVTYRFHAVEMDGIKVEPSPAWLKQRVEAYGMKSINNVVDITNYVMIELGEPLHAFDRRAVKDGIVVRLADEGEVATVLGDRTLKLTQQDIVISDKEGKVLGLGGMIGGVETGVKEDTTSIILEAATYNQAYVRRSSLRHSLRTEASLRHEKFLHPELTEVALSRAVQLLTELCGGKVVAQGDAYPHPVKPITVTVSISYLQKLTGVSISQRQAVEILKDLGIETDVHSEDEVVAHIPYFRTDLTQEEDVIEEVLRIYGYDRVPDTLPASSPPKEITSASYILEEKIRDILVDLGFDEIITEPLTKEVKPVREPVVLQNSLNADKTMLRTTLKNQLLAALSYQRKARKVDVSLFEIGQVYSFEQNEYQEQKMLAGIVSGVTASYLKTKGLLEALALRLQLVYPEQAVILKEVQSNVWYFEVPLAELSAEQDVHAYRIRTSLAQVIYQDVSVTVPVDTKVGEMLQATRSLSPQIYKVELGETPRSLGSNEKTVFLKVQYHKPEGQITTQEVEPIHQQLLEVLTKKFQAKLR